MARLPYTIPYDPNFLGNGFEVPLPKARCQGKLLNNGTPIDYIHFSLVMHQDRRMALYTAHNIDVSQKRSASRTGWNLDPRIDSGAQVGNEAYRNNDWDRGHLVRRDAVTWGPGTEAQDASDSTFYYPVSNLQHKNFNQSGSKWLGLEDWILQKAGAFATRLCVFTGPIYTTFDEEERGVKVPAAFFKIVVLLDPTAEGQDLAALGFIMKQNLNWRSGGQRALTNLEPYHVSIEEIEAYTGLDFGTLAEVDEFDWRQVRFRNRTLMPAIPIGGPEDIIFSGEKRRAKGIRALRTFSSGHEMRQVNPSKKEEEPSEPRMIESDCGCHDQTMDLKKEILALKAQTTALCEIVETLLENQNQGPRSRGVQGGNVRALLSRIIGGQMVGLGEFPECVAIGNEEYGFFCTGVLVHPEVALTAAHCAVEPITQVFLGGRQIANPVEGEFRAVKEVIVHPDYTQAQIPWNDIAVVILETPTTIPPAAIASVEEFRQENELTLVGFGSDSPNGQTGFGTKRKVNVDLTKTADLSSSQLAGIQRTHGFDASKELHGGRVRSGMDSCNGDSGGPAYLKSSVSKDPTSPVKVVGLTSRAAASSTQNCGDGGVYTLIPAYLPWIAEVSNGRIDVSATEETNTTDEQTLSPNWEGLYIEAILPNPEGFDAGNEWVRIKNTSTVNLSLDDLLLEDRQGGRLPLSGIINAEDIRRITIPEGHMIRLGNSGDSIKLMHVDGTLFHEVGYDKAPSGQVIDFDPPVVIDDPTPDPTSPPDTDPMEDCPCKCECKCPCCHEENDPMEPIDEEFTPGALRC